MAARKTKKELKELRRMEKEQQARKSSLDSTSKSSDDMMKWITLGVVAVIVVGLFGFIIYSSQQRSSEQAEISNTRVEISDSGWSKGATESAQVTLVEYADFQCPACKQSTGMIDQALADYGDQVRFVFKHFPLSFHQNAKSAAIAAEAAGRQDKFWEMHDLLFERQGEWSPLGVGEARNKFGEYAQQLGLNVQQFTADMDDSELSQLVDSQTNEGNQLGVMGTPTFFVNGKRVESAYPLIQAAIEAELEDDTQDGTQQNETQE